MFKHELIKALDQNHSWEAAAAEQGFSVVQTKRMIENEMFSFEQLLQLIRASQSSDLLKLIWTQLKPIQKRAGWKKDGENANGGGSIRIH